MENEILLNLPCIKYENYRPSFHKKKVKGCYGKVFVLSGGMVYRSEKGEFVCLFLWLFVRFITKPKFEAYTASEQPKKNKMASPVALGTENNVLVR